MRFSEEVNLATLKDTGAPTGWRVLAFGQLVESEDTNVRDSALALALEDRNRLLRAAAQPAVLERDADEGQKLMTKSFREGDIEVRQRTTAQLAELDRLNRKDRLRKQKQNKCHLSRSRPTKPIRLRPIEPKLNSKARALGF